jgi:signal transduction histidine kinase
MEEVSINYLVKETIPLIQNQAKIQKIIIKINLCQQDVLVYANTSMLQQVLINLFLNAIQSMPDGGMITLSIICSGKEVTLRLVDNGPGISKQNLDKIFDPFYTTSPVGRGTGLGLSISYSIIKQHKGTVEVESREGDGCTFSVRLPRI